jgi:rfaE bifunctional protein kinase chain/domain
MTPTLQQIFQSFNNLSVLIIGDVMLDSYIWGAVERISPEAPVPIVTVKKKDYRLGGAGNVALNIQSLGARPLLCSLIGNDDEGKKLLQCLDDKGISKEGIGISFDRPTTVKTRVIASHQHVVRVDEESDSPLSEREEKEILERITTLLPKCQVVIFEDYDKGVLNPKIIDAVVELARRNNIPTVVDPKKRNFMAYRNVTLFKPNLKELREGMKVDVDAGNQDQVSKTVGLLKEKLGVQGVMVTLSEHGVYIDQQEQKVKLPAHVREISDVSGAGDTVISVAALCVALNLPARLTAALSNLGGGLVCQHTGVVPINKEELLSEALLEKL